VKSSVEWSDLCHFGVVNQVLCDIHFIGYTLHALRKPLLLLRALAFNLLLSLILPQALAWGDVLEEDWL